jgi:hypothetical protein
MFFIATVAPCMQLLIPGALSSPDKIRSLPADENVQEAIKQRIALSVQSYQAALIILGAMWGIVLTKKDEAARILQEVPERLMLLLATLVLISSCWSHVQFVWDMSTSLKSASVLNNKIPDINHPVVTYALTAQHVALAGGAIIGALVVVSGAWIKGEPPRRADGACSESTSKASQPTEARATISSAEALNGGEAVSQGDATESASDAPEKADG